MGRPVEDVTAAGTRGRALPPIAGSALRFLGHSVATPARNMAIDRALLVAAQAPALRFYGWSPPGVSLGWFQREVDVLRFRELGYDVVRRLTGGGAVVHHDEVTYAVVLPVGHPAIAGKDTLATYDAIHAPVRAALEALGLHVAPVPIARAPSPVQAALLCFERASPFDIRVGGVKVVGSAQRRLPDRILQHGSIVLGPNPIQPEQPSLSALAGRPIDAAVLCAALADAFASTFGPLVPSRLTDGEEEAASR